MRLVLLALAAATVAFATPALAAGAPELKASIAKATALMDAAQVRFEKQATCSSCHSQIQPMVAAAARKAKGMAIDQAVFERQMAASAAVIRGRHDYSLNHATIGGSHNVTAPVLVGLAAAGYPADENTDAAVVYLLEKQLASGAWSNVASRPPTGLSEFAITAQAIKAIDAYAPPALRREADASLSRARTWLIRTSAPAEADAMAGRLRGLAWSKAPAAEVRKASAALIAAQRDDGGWGQNAQMPSDAYATGLALTALFDAGVKATDPAYRKGLDYLLRTQAADGSWYVKARALPIQPPIDSGFPYGHDQWMSAWATAYAATAMAYAL